ncbi:MAG: type I-C CRISPR-associated protein Cas8c/Csd1, partial [Eubacteriales bacterium]|nr:type I-C CRISPR-associated protein Cas8c/Csd1 [Clostridiales bacterium]MDY3942146.1 type I-C CRISPR-associated protein Cas8c/Csd1 [Eubacteriales bacterium]
PVGRYAMYAYTTALNHLLGSNETRKQRVRIGDTTVVWWTLDDDREMTELFGAMTFGSLDSSDEPADNDEATIAEVMRKLQNADEIGKLSDRFAKPLCILGISPNAARLSVRFFYRDTFGAFVRNVQAHYDRLAIDKPEYEKPYLPLSELLLETVSKNVRDREKSISALLAGAVYAAIINDWRYPEMLYEQILCRIRAEHTVNARKAAIIKAYLLKNTNMEKEGLGMSLNEECKNQAYVLGRLFAELENAQYQANGVSMLKERYLSSAATTPGLVFPSMLQMASYHIAKIKKDDGKPGAGAAIEGRIVALIDMLEGGKPFPARLNNTEQGLFLEGYYQQVQKNFRTAKENKQNKEELA